MSAEGAENALGRVGEKAGQMADRLQREGAKAGSAVDSIGAGADKSAEQFSRAEGKMAASIKRATTNLEQLGKTASEKLQFQINQKGLDASKFEPLLGKLRELEAERTEKEAAVNIGVEYSTHRGHVEDLKTRLGVQSVREIRWWWRGHRESWLERCETGRGGKRDWQSRAEGQKGTSGRVIWVPGVGRHWMRASSRIHSTTWSRTRHRCGS